MSTNIEILLQAGVPGEVGATGASGNLSPNWATDTEYLLNQICIYGGMLYRCTNAHTSSSSFESANFEQVPAIAPMLLLSISAAQTIDIAQRNSFIKLTATEEYTITMPTPVDYGGAFFDIWNSSDYVITLSSVGFYGPYGSSATTLTIAAGVSIKIISDGANWIAVSMSS